MSKLIPLLRDLCFRDCGYEVPPGFVEDFVKRHHADWLRSQDHWERMVVDVLSSEVIKQREPEERAMKLAVAISSRLLHETALRDRCRQCRTGRR
ncbi:DUF6313 family protein [Nonomuraea candida]|uniref:DUF6313 family protein n=1 Tax=Nonomuraea candida TaxID=359159 RepID=UPI0006934178|nr:DUF6313 family protein [Nonomuraea candida]